MFDKIKKINLKRKYGTILPMQQPKEDYREFLDKEEANSWGESIYMEWAKIYKEMMKVMDKYINNRSFVTALECYLGDMHREINKTLRNKKQERKYSRLTYLMKVIVCSAPRIPEDIVVYRKVDNNFVELLIHANKTKNGSTFKEAGFMSTSLVAKTLIDRKGEYYSEYKNMLKIYVKKNTIAFYADVIRPREELEMVIYPNYSLRMIEYPYLQNDIMIYECELITYKN